MLDGIQFDSFSEFLAMGGHAFNVWSVYALFLIFLLANVLGPLQTRKRIYRELKRRTLINQTSTQTSEPESGLHNDEGH